MIKLPNTVAAWNTPEFESVLKTEIESLEPELLPLQQALSQSSYVSESPFRVSIISVIEKENHICIKAGIFFTGIIAGSCCADDPTPVDEQTEYCELEFMIDRAAANAVVEIISAHE